MKIQDVPIAAVISAVPPNPVLAQIFLRRSFMLIKRDGEDVELSYLNFSQNTVDRINLKIDLLNEIEFEITHFA
jgi:hypothetical protein